VPIDPDRAIGATLGRPILHGLCTYGMVRKAVVDGLLDGDAALLGRFSARFADVVFPGRRSGPATGASTNGSCLSRRWSSATTSP
jgi:acyl dehydratase